MGEGVIASGVDEAGLAQDRKGITQLHEPTSQTTAGCVTDAHVLDHFRRLDSTLVQIGDRFSMAMQLHAIETSDFVQQRS